jgi:hypothetical protein
VNVIGQIFFTDCFLGWEFSQYGVSAVTLLEKKVKTLDMNVLIENTCRDQNFFENIAKLIETEAF